MPQAAVDADRIAEVIERHVRMDGAALPMLHAIQEAFGYVPEQAVPMVAQALNRSRAEIHGVVTFYHDFREAPAGRHVVKVCRAEACQSMGGEAVAARIQRQLGIGWGETSPDGRVTLEPIYCLGLCACAPSAMVDGELVGRLDDEAADAIVAGVAA